MESSDIKEIVEEYPVLVKREKQYQEKLIRISGRNPTLEASIMAKLEKVEQKIEFVDNLIFEYDILTDKESLILGYRAEGYSNSRIGELFKLHRETIRKTLDTIYFKLANELKEYRIAT